jgi:integrase
MAYVRSKDGGWQANWRLPNGKIRSKQSTRWTKREAIRYAQRKEDEANRTPWATGGTKAPSFADYAGGWFAERIVSPKTRSKERAMEKRLIAEFGDLRLDQVSPDHVRTFVKGLQNRVSKGYVADYVGLLRGIFDQAVEEDGHLDVSPVQVTHTLRKSRAKPKSRAVAIPPEHARQIAEAVNADSRIMVLTMMATGVRIGELLALKKSDLDMKTGKVSISRTLSTDENGRVVVKDSPKTNAGNRVLDLPRWLLAEMEIYLITLAPTAGSWLFPAPGRIPKGQRRTRPLTYWGPTNWRDRRWFPTVETLGFNRETHRPHNLRHLHASILIAQGIDLAEISYRLGHEGPHVTLAIYGHWIKKDTSTSAAAVPDFTDPEALRRAGFAAEV